MVEMSVGEFKANFSKALDVVNSGEEVMILYGRAKKPVARLTPAVSLAKSMRKARVINCLKGIATMEMADDWKMTYEELCDL